MEQQIDEFKERESSTKMMYDKILLALNSQENESYQMDITKVQELLQQMFRGSPIPQQEVVKIKQQDMVSKAQIETLEFSLQHLSDSYNKLKQAFTSKDKEVTMLQKELQELKESHKEQLQKLDQELNLLQKEKQLSQEAFIEKECSLRKQQKEEMEKFKDLSKYEKEMLENKIKDLENIVSQKLKQEQLIALDKSFQKENQELKQLIERLKRERERDDENWNKEREQLQQQINIQDQIIGKIKKQMNNNLANNNEATKRLKQKLQEAEKDVGTKNEEILKLKNKITVIKAQNTKIELQERKQSQLINTSQVYKENILAKALDMGRDSHTPMVDTSQLELTKKKSTGVKVPNRSSKIKMFGNEINNNQMVSSHTRNINCQSQISLASKEQPHNMMMSRSQTPNAKQKQMLSKQIHQQISISQAMQKQRSQRKLDLVYQSETLKNNQLTQILHLNDEEQREEEEDNENQSLTPRINKEGQKVLFTSMEIESVVRKMIDQVKNENTSQQQQQMLANSSQHNSVFSSQNVSFSQKKHKQFEQDFKPTQCSLYNRSNNYFMIDKDFLAKLETSLKKLTKSNEKIKQIMKEKETFKKQCSKLKQKVSFLKEEKQSLQRERDILMVQNQKFECRLKQAQVILNIESDHSQNIGNKTIYDIPSDMSTIKKSRADQVRDHSVHSQSKITLSIPQEPHFNSRYNNPPMSCRVNDSCETSLKMSTDLNHASQVKRNLFQQTLDKSILDQSNITIKRSQHQTHINQSLSRFMPSCGSTATIPNNHPSQLNRGKTPTLQINLAKERDRSSQWLNDNEDSSIITSRLLCKSTTNLATKHHNHQQQQQTERKIQNNFWKYSTIRDSQTKLFRSPQMNKVNTSTNYNTTGIRDRSPRQIQNSKISALQGINPSKTKNRYYSRRVIDQHCNKLDKQINQCLIEQEDDCISIDENEIVNINTYEQDWTTNEQDKQLIHKEKNSYCYLKDQEIIQPSDEREGGEETLQLKLLNSTQFIPSMHARYITLDDSHHLQ